MGFARHAKSPDKALLLPELHYLVVDQLPGPLSGLFLVFAMQIQDRDDMVAVIEKVEPVMLHGWL
jgi:hypothetical protein